MKFLITISLLLGTAPAFAARDKVKSCTNSLRADAAKLDAELKDFNYFIELFRERELNELISSVHAKRVDVIPLMIGAPRPPVVTVRRPKAKGGRVVIEFTHLAHATPKQHQQAEWALANALFEVEIGRRLNDMPPRSRGGLGGVRARPRQVSQYQLRQINALLSDLYKVIDGVPLLAPEDLLPRKDPGRPWLPVLGLLRGPPTNLRPNLHDLQKYWHAGSGGESALTPAIEDRYERMLVYAHWRRYAKRAVATTVAAGVVATGVALVAPHSATIAPPTPEVSTSQTEPVQPIRESEMTEAEKQAAIAELRSLEDQLEKTRHQSMSEPPTREIEKLKQKILNKKLRYPFLLLINDQPTSR